MKKIIIFISLTLFNLNHASAVTLYDALNQTYQNNIQLNAERENIKASVEDVNISQSEYKPTLTLSGSKSLENTNKLTNQSGGDATVSDADPLNTSIKLEQTILDYGRDLTFEKNLIGLDLAKAKLVKKEQDVFYSAIDAFTNLILAREKLGINKKNLNLLNITFSGFPVEIEGPGRSRKAWVCYSGPNPTTSSRVMTKQLLEVQDYKNHEY